MKDIGITTNKSKIFVRECIYEAVIGLMRKHKWSNITITQIIERAGVSRMGFYRNFKSKENVVEEFIYEKFLETVKEIEDKQKLNFGVYDIMETTLEIFTKYASFVGLFLQQGLEYLIYQCYMKGFYALYKREHITRMRDYYNQIFIGQLFNLEMAWLKNGMKETPRQLANLYYKILNLQYNNRVDF